jgi:hypothetical protein
MMIESRDTAALNFGPAPELKTEESTIQISSTTLDKDIAAFKRVFSSDAFIKQAAENERDIDRRRRIVSARTHQYFIPKDGIDREVIATDICRYLGNDALVRTGQYEVHIPT